MFNLIKSIKMATQNHPKIRNKREDQVQINENQWNSKHRVRKNYIIADKKATQGLKSRNRTVEALYHAVLKKVVQLYSNLPKESDRIVVEMDMKLHPLDNAQMHAFLTPHFLFFLECDFYNHYQIEYWFHNCPFEAVIRDAMKGLIVGSYSTEARMMKDYPTYFKEVLRCQPDRFIRVL